jgi:metallo-beta-lactamase class B
MSGYRKSIQISILILSLSLAGLCSTAQKITRPDSIPETWTKRYDPFRIVGNLYYVGTYDLACYLITTPEGHILINTGYVGSDSLIRSQVEALGFKIGDIKILLATHAHYDHVGAMAAIKRNTGAKMMIHEDEASVLTDGGNSDYVFGGKGWMFEPVKADRLLHNLDTIKFGNMRIVVLHHPGHTKGACSFLFDVKDQNRIYRVLIANMPTILDKTKLSGMPDYPNVGRDYAYTLSAMKNLTFDIWLSSHASQFNLHQKRQPGDGYHPEAFIDPRGYDSSINELQKEYSDRLQNK